MKAKQIKYLLKLCLFGCTDDGCPYNDMAVCNGIECITCAELLLRNVYEVMEIGEKAYDEIHQSEEPEEIGAPGAEPYRCGTKEEILPGQTSIFDEEEGVTL